MSEVIVVKEQKRRYNTCKLEVDGHEIAKVTVGIDDIEKMYTITAWYVIDGFKHQGYGRMVLQFMFEELSKDYRVQYIWDGTNEYVGAWLAKFNAKCIAPLAVLKTQSADDWESHIYELDAKKFFEYLKD